ncbi:MAG: MATE family efflux transporter [Methyloligellaceae bacterium]
MQNPKTARFVSGPTMGHVMTMTSTAAFGLVAIFLVDFVDLYFISLLGEQPKAALGFALPVSFVMVSIGLGLGVAGTVLTANALGAGNKEKAQCYTTNIFIVALCSTGLTGLTLWLSAPGILYLLGATGETYRLALGFLRISSLSAPFIGTSICLFAILRANGTARIPMLGNLAGAIVNAILDPVLIFYFEMGMEGAAVATVLARIVTFSFALTGIFIIYRLINRPTIRTFLQDLPQIGFYSLPALSTSIATPLGDAVVTSSISRFGDGAVAGWAIVSRIIPLAFGTLFALSGAIGPIVGQNLGAKMFDRVRGTLLDAIHIILIYIFIIWLILSFSYNHLADFFSASEASRDLIRAFCLWYSPMFAFMGMFFISNSTFNNLGKPYYSMGMNWVRATLGTAPMVYIGGNLYGPNGVIGAYMINNLVFGCCALILCHIMIHYASRQ